MGKATVTRTRNQTTHQSGLAMSQSTDRFKSNAPVIQKFYLYKVAHGILKFSQNIVEDDSTKI